MAPRRQGKRMAFVNLFLANKTKGLRMGTDSNVLAVSRSKTLSKLPKGHLLVWGGVIYYLLEMIIN